MPFTNKNLLLAASLLTAGSFLTGCTSPLKQSTQYYHAPAQAYNLFLGNTAIQGKPTLRQSCSENGSSLEIIDAHGDYFKVDVINLLANPSLTPSEDKLASAARIAEWYRKLYNAPFYNPPLGSVNARGSQQLYIPLPLDKPNPVAEEGRVVGMLVFKQGDFLYNIQHMQHHYNQAQMLSKLQTLYTSMDVPGVFKKPKKRSQKIEEIEEHFGIINIDPNSASAEEIAQWREKAHCS